MRDVTIVGAGVAGLAAGIFTARAGLDTLIVDGGESILARNASLENYPGFPDGVDARRYLRLAREQAANAGCSFEEGLVVSAASKADSAEAPGPDTGFVLERDAGDSLETSRIIAASWPDSEYLVSLDVGRTQRGSKYVLQVDGGGRTAVEGVYAAGRLAGRPHQTIVSAGHGATAALAAIHDADVAFYHDWVAPEGYFTGRGREVPPACEEIDDAERRRRDDRSRQTILAHSAEPYDDEPTMHLSVEDG